MKNGTNNIGFYVRSILLLLTIVLFFVFFYLFSLSYKQYDRIEYRASVLTQKLIENEDEIDLIMTGYDKIISQFRLFNKEKDTIDFTKYKKVLKSYNDTIKSIISKKKKYIETNDTSFIRVESHINLLNSYIELKKRTDKLLEFSDRISIFLKNKNSIQPNESKRIKLLEENFNLLYDVNKALLKINQERYKARKIIRADERENASKEARHMLYLTTFCLIFTFVLICVIIYYQAYTTIFILKLNHKRSYANKLADKNAKILSEITHEIRTPLNSLIGVLDIVRKKITASNQKDILLIDSAYTSIINTSKIINDILNTNVYEEIENKFASFDIEKLIMELINQHECEAVLKGLALLVEINQNTPTIIFTDRDKIKKIVNNLLSNAIKFSEKGTVSCEVKIVNESIIRIIIKDQGIGISPIILNNIFNRYFTAELDEKHSHGLGLGLYITKKLVTSLKGIIHVDSIVNVGSKFTVSIPIPKPEFKKNEMVDVNNIDHLLKTITWLLVDDNDLNLFYLSHFFINFPNLKTAKNGIEAMKIIENEHIDIVITDINMPKMTGDELLVKIRAQSEFNHIKVIATSSDNVQIRKRENTNNCYFDGVLIKPFNEQDLTEAIFSTIN